MRVMGLLVAVVLAACASVPRGGQAGLEGTYQLMRVNDERLPASAGDEVGVMIHSGTLALHADSRYVLRIVAATQNTPEQRNAEIAGRYRVFGDSLAMVPDPGAGSDEVHFLWTLRGNDLRLHDEDGDEYMFRRQ
jgi:hypothetical protein